MVTYDGDDHQIKFYFKEMVFMANKNSGKNLLLALGALGSIFGGVQKTSGIDAVTLYSEADIIGEKENEWTKYEKAVELINQLIREKVVPTSRKNQSLNHI